MPPGQAYKASLNGGAAVPAVSGGGGGPGSAFRSSVTPAAAASPKKSGGFLSKLTHPLSVVGNAIGTAADATANVADALGTGLYQEGAALDSAWRQTYYHPFISPSKELKSLTTLNPVAGTSNTPQASAVVKGLKDSTVKAFTESPSKDPVNFGLNLLAAVSVGAGAVARTAYAADALGAASDASAVAKAAGAADLRGAAAAEDASALRGAAVKAAASPLHKPPVKLRFVNVPKVVLKSPEGGAEGPAAAVRESTPVQLHASNGNVVRLVQAGHDRIVQKALDNSTGVADQSLTAKYANARVGGSVGEGTRVTQNLRAVPEKMLGQAGLRGPVKAVLRKSAFDEGVSQKAGQLALFLRSANVTGAEAAAYWAQQAERGAKPAAKLAALAQHLEDNGVLRQNPAGDVEVAADKFPKLGNADTLTREAQQTRADIISQHGLMNPEGMQNRLDLVAQKVGVGRQGQGFTSLKTSVKPTPNTNLAQARTPVIPKAKGFIASKRATGSGVETGRIPDDTTAGVARSLHEALRYQNTVDFRGRVAKFGSDVRRTGNDVLVRDPALEKEGAILPPINELLGRSKSTLNTVSEEEHQGLADAMRARLEDAIPHLNKNSDNGQLVRAAGIGTRAPEGFKWVPKQMIPAEITKTAEPRTRLAKVGDTINSAVTAATVYLKVGHLPTRAFTNASTNILQGSATPRQVGLSARLVGQLTEEEKREVAAITGTHGYAALPHAGQTKIATVAGKGAGWWSKNIDAPFRINSVLYEFRQIGIDTPEQVRLALKQLKDPARTGVSASRAAKLDWAVRRANRQAIMYDGINDIEKRYLTRYFWFYPWTKAAVRFAGHTAAEHPFKAAAGAAIGQSGASYRQQKLGNVPSYELNLTPLGGGSNPLTTNLSTFTPFSTVGQVAQLAAHPLSQDSGVFSQLNPAYSGLAALVQGKGLKGAAGQAISPTPEMQAGVAAASPRGAGLFPTSSQYLFGRSWQSTLARGFAGSAFPRRVSKSRLATDYAHEHEKKRTLTIYG